MIGYWCAMKSKCKTRRQRGTLSLTKSAYEVVCREKIGVAFALALLIQLVVGIVAYRSTAQLIETVAAVEHTDQVLQALVRILDLARDLEIGQRGYVITGDEAFLEPYHAALNGLDAAIKRARELTVDNDQQQRRLDLVQALVAEQKTFSIETVELRRSSGYEPAQRAVASRKGKGLMDQLRVRVAEMEENENELRVQRSAKAQQVAQRSLATIVVGTALSVILVSLAGLVLGRNIAAPLEEITRVAERIEHGDLSVEFTSDGRADEVGALQRSFQRMSRALNLVAGRARQIAEGDLTAQVRPQSERDVLGTAFAKMAEKLRRIVEDILEAANVLASSATEIMASTAQLAASAAETATAVTQTTTTVEEVKQTSQVSSQKAKYVSDEAQRAVDVAQVGKQSVDRTVEGMNGIRQQMAAVAESILGLSAQSQAIGAIIATVDDLASQSKILAVNASIEAAKAGEEGKGFSVVAQEVRSLAEQSRQATTKVRGILNDIQKATTNAVLAAEEGSKAVEGGVRQTQAAGASITALAETIARAAQAATQIAATSQQQFVGMDQVALAMDSIKSASTQTVASTKQAESAAQQLHEIGQKLKQLVERFKV